MHLSLLGFQLLAYFLYRHKHYSYLGYRKQIVFLYLHEPKHRETTQKIYG